MHCRKYYILVHRPSGLHVWLERKILAGNVPCACWAWRAARSCRFMFFCSGGTGWAQTSCWEQRQGARAKLPRASFWCDGEWAKWTPIHLGRGTSQTAACNNQAKCSLNRQKLGPAWYLPGKAVGDIPDPWIQAQLRRSGVQRPG